MRGVVNEGFYCNRIQIIFCMYVEISVKNIINIFVL